jgi:adenosylmethionine-8-amino-7-oxononanoate aminotransferase
VTQDQNDDFVFERTAITRPPFIERGDGIYLFDESGKRYIDASGGVSVVTIGHGVSEIKEAMIAQFENVSFAHPWQWRNRTLQDLCKKIIQWAPEGMTKVFMVSGGSEATESAIKMARQYQLERGKPSKYKILSRWSSYHGNTLGSLSASGMPARRIMYDPLFNSSAFPKIPQVNCYRCPFDSDISVCGLKCAHALETQILQEGPDNVAAFIAEPIVSAASGCPIPPEGYFTEIREICNRYDVLFIADEVVTGFGRTGKNFCLDHWNVVPDIICCGKGMSSGYAPLGAVIANEDVSRTILEGSGGLNNGFTFGGNPMSAAIGFSVLEYMERHSLADRVADMGPGFVSSAQRKLSQLEMVGDVRGLGFLIGIELVSDKQSRAPFDPSIPVSARIVEEARSRGLVILGNQGGIDGTHGHHLLLVPPYISTEEQLDEILELTRQSIEAVSNRLEAG